MELTDDDVIEILKLFEQSTFDYLQLEQGERKITISKGGYRPGSVGAAETAPAPRSIASPPPAAAANPQPLREAAPRAASAGPHDPDLVAIAAPMVGKYYAAPSPADPPYVELGSTVSAGATVGLIEVMKVFASIKTEIGGTIEQILVTNGDFVEAGQPLFLLRRDGAAQG